MNALKKNLAYLGSIFLLVANANASGQLDAEKRVVRSTPKTAKLQAVAAPLGTPSVADSVMPNIYSEPGNVRTRDYVADGFQEQVDPFSGTNNGTSSFVYNDARDLTCALCSRGTHSLTATYNADPLNASSVSAPISIAVVAAL